jgi:WD40 repeat protein
VEIAALSLSVWSIRKILLVLVLLPQLAQASEFYSKTLRHSFCWYSLFEEQVAPSQSSSVQVRSSFGWSDSSGSLQYAAAGKYLVYKTGTLVTVVEADSFKELLTFSADAESYSSNIFVSPNGERIVVAKQIYGDNSNGDFKGYEVKYTSYEVPSGREINNCSVSIQSDQIQGSGVISSDGSKLLGYLNENYGEESDFGIVDLKAGNKNKLLSLRYTSIPGVSISRNGRYAAVREGSFIGKDGKYVNDKRARTIHIIDMNQKSIVNQFVHPNINHHSDFVIDNSAQIYYSYESNLELWDGLTGRYKSKANINGRAKLLLASEKGALFEISDQIFVHPVVGEPTLLSTVALQKDLYIRSNREALNILSGSDTISFELNDSGLVDYKRDWIEKDYQGFTYAVSDDFEYRLFGGEKGLEIHDIKPNTSHFYTENTGGLVEFDSVHSDYVLIKRNSHPQLNFELVKLPEMKAIWESGAIHGIEASARFGSYGKYFYVAAYDGIEIRDIKTGRLKRSIAYPEDMLSWFHLVEMPALNGRYFFVQFSVSPSGQELFLWGGSIASGSRDSKKRRNGHGLYYWNLFTGEIKSYSISDDTPYGLGFSNDGDSYFYAHRTSGKITRIDLENGKRFHYLTDQASVKDFISVGTNRFITLSEDGTIKIWDYDSPLELGTISIFENDEWIITTPEGFYNASPNGAKYLTVKAGNQVLSVEQLHSQLFRPDLVAVKFSAQGNKEAFPSINLKQLASVAPPVIAKTSSPDASVRQREQTFEVSIKDEGNGIGRVEWRLNGLLVGVDNTERALKRKSAGIGLSKVLTLSPGQNTIELVAFDASNSVSSDALQWNVTLKDAISEKPTLHILSVGVNKYRDKSLWLNYAVPDAKALSNKLASMAQSVFTDVNVHHLLDGDVTTEGLNEAFKKLSQSVSSNDVFVFYLAGHGITQDGRYHFLPANFRFRDGTSVAKQGVSQDELQLWMSRVPAQKSLVLLDTCNSGGYVKAQANTRGIADKTAIAKLTRATGRAIIAASSDTQVAYEGYKGHGVFTWALIEGLAKADKAYGNRDGITTTNELASFIDEQVPDITYNKWGYEQVPQVNLHGRQFPIGLSH